VFRDFGDAQGGLGETDSLCVEASYGRGSVTDQALVGGGRFELCGDDRGCGNAGTVLLKPQMKHDCQHNGHRYCGSCTERH
jgi:hypothetical protein